MKALSKQTILKMAIAISLIAATFASMSSMAIDMNTTQEAEQEQIMQIQGKLEAMTQAMEKNQAIIKTVKELHAEVHKNLLLNQQTATETEQKKKGSEDTETTAVN